jgi:hypothetical protein
MIHHSLRQTVNRVVSKNGKLAPTVVRGKFLFRIFFFRATKLIHFSSLKLSPILLPQGPMSGLLSHGNAKEESMV